MLLRDLTVLSHLTLTAAFEVVILNLIDKETET